MSLNSIYSLNTLAKLCCSFPCFLLSSFFFFFSIFIFLIYNCLTLCISTSLNLYSSWVSWGMHQLRIDDGTLLKKEGRHTVNDDILLKFTRWQEAWNPHQSFSDLEGESSLLHRFTSKSSIYLLFCYLHIWCASFSDAAVQLLIGCYANQQGWQGNVSFTTSFQQEVLKQQVGVAIPNID